MLKIISFLKNYWYIPVGLIVAIIMFIATRSKKPIVDWFEILKDANESHAKSVKRIEAAKQKQVEETERALRRMAEAQQKIQDEYDRNQRELDSQQKKRVDSIIKQLRDDPRAMADALEKETGYRVLIIE